MTPHHQRLKKSATLIRPSGRSAIGPKPTITDRRQPKEALQWMLHARFQRPKQCEPTKQNGCGRPNDPVRPKKIYNTKEMHTLEQNNLPNYRMKQQQVERERMWQRREEGHVLECGRQLQRMVPGSARLPTTPQLWLMIKLQPILNPVNDPKHNK